MKKLSFIFATVLLFAGATVVNAQSTTTASHTVAITIAEHALVGIKGSTTSNAITITPTLPTEAGDPLSFASSTKNSDLWLNYSSIVQGTKRRTITAALSANTLPLGISLQLAATTVDPNGNGKGELGTTSMSTATTLTGTAQEVIGGIGSCHTSKGQNQGSNLTYSVIVNNVDYATLVASGYSTTVTYTITDDL